MFTDCFKGTDLALGSMKMLFIRLLVLITVGPKPM